MHQNQAGQSESRGKAKGIALHGPSGEGASKRIRLSLVETCFVIFIKPLQFLEMTGPIKVVNHETAIGQREKAQLSLEVGGSHAKL